MSLRGVYKFTVAIGVAFALLAVTPAAQAGFPGEDGRVAFSGIQPDAALGIYVTSPMGSQLTVTYASEPAWSADGLRLAFSTERDGNREIYSATAVGAGQTRLTVNGAADGNPAWSPDGGRIVFSSTRDGNAEIYVMDADGSNATRLTNDPGTDYGPAWSPDGSKIAFGCGTAVCVMDPDGTDRTSLGTGRNPDWSPDGSQIAFDAEVVYPDPDPEDGEPCQETQSEIFKMNADGSGRTQLTFGACTVDFALDIAPAWSPEGATIAFQESLDSIFTSPDLPTRVMLVPAGGGGYGELGGGPTDQFGPAWQPIILSTYPRPKAATPLHASLVPAHRACQATNRVHAAPLSHDACNPPDRNSAVLTMGTPDANGAPANFTGSARYRVISGDAGTPLDEADLGIEVSLTDVRCAATSAACPGGPMSDYAGRVLLINPPLRITDKDGQPASNGQGAATGQTNFPVPFDCTPTPATAIGASCSVSTTADALVPNVIKEGHRAIWESGPVHVRDPGPNGTGFGAGCPPACGDGDETLFLRQGVFVP